MPSPWKAALAPLKPWLLPLWNGGHRLAWRAGEIASALLHRRVGPCSCCGRRSLFLRREWVVWPELKARWGLSGPLALALAIKETDSCLWCSAPTRSRRLADALLHLYPAPGARSLRDWALSPSSHALRIAEINEVPGLHRALYHLPLLSYSEFLPGTPPGSTNSAGLRCEDMQSLSYPDSSLDLVLHSESLEHIPDLPLALRELSRVLSPGGLTLFTAPVLPHTPTTFPRARLSPSGSIIPLVPPLISHPGGDWGYPVFWELGTDLPSLLLSAGFSRVATLSGPLTDSNLAVVFAAWKA